MKIRKGLLAAATAATVSFSGVVAAPAFAAPETDTTVSANETDKEKRSAKEIGAELKALSSDKDGQLDPKAIVAWIAAFSAVLGLIGQVITFAQKNFNIKR